MSDQELVVRPPSTSCVPGHNGRLYPVVGQSLKHCPMSFDPDTPAGQYLLMAAGNPGDIEFDKNGVAEIVATNWLIFPEERPDPDTGEIGSFARTVLFTADGDMFRTTSAHAPHRIQAALEACTEQQWKDGVHFVIRERKGKRGFTYHDIRLHAKYLKG